MAMSGLLRHPWREGLARALPFTHDRRGDPRYAVPHLTLVVGETQYTTLDWSVSGGRIKQPEYSLDVSDRIRGKLYLEGDRRAGGFVAEVARLTPAGDVGLRWLTLSGEIASAMA
jgi:hypothetical protein